MKENDYKNHLIYNELHLVSLAEDDLVVAEAERVPVERHRVKVDVRVGALRLPGARPVKVPDRQFWMR